MSVQKFRMWDGKEMLTNQEIKHYELGVLQGTSYKMMSSTGLLDKQGVEIYVGDILDVNCSHFKAKGQVVFRTGRFLIKWKALDYSDIDGDNLYSEVIGNIYENKELINQ